MIKLASTIGKSPALAGLFFILALASCQSPETPDQVALKFWQAMAANDLASAEQYTTSESRPLLQSPEQKFQGASFAIGQIVIDNDQARVETEARQANDKTTTFTTFLVKEEQQWRVDYRRTRYSLSEDIFNGLFDSLKNIGENLNKQLEQQMPEIEKEMESFGQELKKQLDSLGEELEKSFPPPPEKKTDPYRDSI